MNEWKKAKCEEIQIFKNSNKDSPYTYYTKNNHSKIHFQNVLHFINHLYIRDWWTMSVLQFVNLQQQLRLIDGNVLINYSIFNN